MLWFQTYAATHIDDTMNVSLFQLLQKNMIVLGNCHVIPLRLGNYQL